MRTSFQIYMRTDLSLTEASRQVASALDLRRVQRGAHDTMWLVPRLGHPIRTRGLLCRSDRSAADAEPASLLHRYDIAWIMLDTCLEARTLRVRAERAFAATVDRLAWPSLLVEDHTWLVEIWLPQRGGFRFHAGTTTDPTDKPVWGDFAPSELSPIN